MSVEGSGHIPKRYVQPWEELLAQPERECALVVRDRLLGAAVAVVLAIDLVLSLRFRLARDGGLAWAHGRA